MNYSSEVSGAFLECHGNKTLTGVEKMNLRYDVAKNLFTEKYSHLTDELEREAIEQHKVDLKQWGLILDDISLGEDVSQ